MAASERIPLSYQYEELELSYLERRDRLMEDERRGRVTDNMRPLRHLRLQRLRAARETLYRLAQDDPDGAQLAANLARPQDMESAA